VRRDKNRLEQVVNEIRYRRSLRPTPELESGRRAHLALEKGRSVEKDIDRIVESINSREKPFYMTAVFCSPTFGGLRCQPDAVLVEASGDTLRLRVIEDKTSNQARYYTQLYAEAVILTDRNCLVAPAIEEEELGLGGRLDQRRMPFYQRLRNFENFIVEACLNPYGAFLNPLDRPLPPIGFSVNFHMSPETETKYYVVTQSKKAILQALHHPQQLGEEQLTQTKFARKGKELKLYTPRG
jgi:hypothetical protein